MNRWAALLIASLLMTSGAFADDQDIHKMRYKKERALDRVTEKFEAAIPSQKGDCRTGRLISTTQHISR